MAKVHEPIAEYVVGKRGKRTRVILPVGEYERLLDDVKDLAVMFTRKNEPSISWQDVKKRLKKDGLI